MRLLSYNILDGGVGRADPLAEVIQSHQPDAVVLVEADDADVVQRIAGRLEMDAVHVMGRRHGAAILSRWNIRQSINHSLLNAVFNDCVLEAMLVDPAGKPITLAAVHLNPRASEADERVREKEVAALLKIFARHRSESLPHVLAGDFNANSPIQQIDPKACKPKTCKEIAANGGILPRRAVQKLLDAGYVDSLHAVRGAAAQSAGSFTTLHPGQRVDYIFTYAIEPGRLTDAGVEQDRLAQFASDHFPVYATL